MRNLFIADRQDITQAGIKYLVSSIDGIDPVETLQNKRDLITNLINKPAAIVIIDYLLFDFSSVDEMLIISQRFPKSNWIIFSETLTDDFLKRVVYEGDTLSILLKSSPMQEIQSALIYALRHERFICPRVSNQLLNANKSAKEKSETALTSTEKEILKAIALGKTTKEIAAERNLSFHTIITHRKNIFRKLDVNNVHEATKHAMRAGIIDPTEYYI
jgi:DNA-binding NarL/FixJ family response regulator